MAIYMVYSFSPFPVRFAEAALREPRALEWWGVARLFPIPIALLGQYFAYL